MAVIHEIDQLLWLKTPKGDAIAKFVIDRGIDSDLEWVVIQNETGEFWSWMNYDVRASGNITIGRNTGRISMARKYEGSAADTAKDKREAKRRGISMKKWEGSAADRRMDRAGQKNMKKRGR